MNTYHKFNAGVSPNNKILKYMSFSKKDCVLRDFIDYLSFYTTWNHKIIYSLMASDNTPTLYLSSNLTLVCYSNKGDHFHAQLFTSYLGNVVPFCILKECKIQGKVQLKIDIGGQGLKVMRDNKSYYTALRLFFSDWLCLGDDLNITRIDYTVDTMKLNFRKENSLDCKVKGRFETKDGISYKLFGRKGHDSAQCIRYYNKKLEIKKRHTEFLYPEYSLLPEVMRYEMRVNSKGLDRFEKIIKLDQLFDVISLGYEIPSEFRSHSKGGKDLSDYEQIEKLIKKLKIKKDIDSLNRVRLLLENIHVLGGSDLVV